MAEVVPLPRPEYRATSMEELWAEAETLGKVSVRDWFGKYQAEIDFRTRTGTFISAKAEHKSPAVALGLVINEARSYGAGTPG